MNSDVVVKIEFGHVSLVPYHWVTDERGRTGQQYLRIDYDQRGNEISRKVLEPVAWLIWN